jgi:hypothetical protein
MEVQTYINPRVSCVPLFSTFVSTPLLNLVTNHNNQCVYYHHGGGKGVILCLYVDDILIFVTSLDMINEVKTFLC